MDIDTYNNNFLPLENDFLRREVAHLRLQKRNGRKSITTITGLEQDLDFVRLLRAFKKKFKCIGSLDIEEKTNIVLAIKLSGDQRENVKNFLLSEEIIPEERNIIIHGG